MINNMISSSTSTSGTNTIKVEYEGDIRKFKDITSYDDLVNAISRSFGWRVLRCKFYYVDDDNDKITVTNDEDLQEAISYFKPRPPKLVLQKFLYKDKHTIGLSSQNENDTVFSDFDNISDISLIGEIEEKEVVHPQYQINIQKGHSLSDIPEESKELSRYYLKESFQEESKLEGHQEHVGVPSLMLPTNSNDNELQKWAGATLEVREQPSPHKPSLFRERSLSLKVSSDEAPFEYEIPSAQQKWGCLTARNVPTKQNFDDIETVKADLSRQIAEEFSKLDISNMIRREVSAIVPAIVDQISENLKPTRFRNTRPNSAVHTVVWNEWNSDKIYGTRYKCIVCRNYNICEDCEDQVSHCHALLKIKQPEDFVNLIDELSTQHQTL